MKIIVAAGFTCLLASGCGGAASSSDGVDSKATPTGTILPQRLDQPDTDPDLEPDAPADDAPFSKQLEHELSVRTLKMAQGEGKATAQCPSDIESNKGRTAACTTTYDGLKVRWDVTIGDKAAWSESYVEYKATLSTGIFVSHRKQADSEPGRQFCDDSSIPFIAERWLHQPCLPHLRMRETEQAVRMDHAGDRPGTETRLRPAWRHPSHAPRRAPLHAPRCHDRGSSHSRSAKRAPLAPADRKPRFVRSAS